MRKTFSEEISMDNCFSERKPSTQAYSKEQLNENPESNINSNNDIDFEIEPTIDTITKTKYGIKKPVDIDIQILNNISKANNDSINGNSHNTNNDHVSNTNKSSKEQYRNKDNQKGKKNEKSSIERKRNQETKETSTDHYTRERKKNQAYI